MISISTREAIRMGISEEMRNNEDVFILGEEVGEYNGAYKVTQGLLTEFGSKRVIDTPITEQGFTGLAIGAAFYGLKPIVEFMTFNFAMQAIDQIINSSAKTHYMSGGLIKSSIVFRGPNGAASRVAAQHSQCYAAWYSHIPGLKVIMPYSQNDHKGLIKSAIRDQNPVIFLENEILYNDIGEVNQSPDFLIEIGKANIITEGEDITIVSFGIQMKNIIEVAIVLKNKYSIKAEIIDLRTIRPLDIDTIIRSVKKTNRILVVEEGWPFCSVSSEIITQVIEKAFDYLDAQPKRVTGKDVPLPYAENLEKAALVSSKDILNSVLDIFNINHD